MSSSGGNRSSIEVLLINYQGWTREGFVLGGCHYIIASHVGMMDRVKTKSGYFSAEFAWCKNWNSG